MVDQVLMDIILESTEFSTFQYSCKLKHFSYAEIRRYYSIAPRDEVITYAVPHIGSK